MISWKSTLDVSDIWMNEPDEKLFKEIGQRVMTKADEMLVKGQVLETDRDDLWSLGDAIQFAVDQDDFNQLWNDVYDWADYQKRLWVKIESWM